MVGRRRHFRGCGCEALCAHEAIRGEDVGARDVERVGNGGGEEVRLGS